jgi:hypothetical protein
MTQPMIDTEALITMFENATAQQGAQFKKAVSDATLAGLHGRELTLKNIRGALKSVSEAASQGAAKNAMAGMDVESLLDNAVAGMNDALLKAVDANRVALQQLVSQGADLREKHLKKALDDLDKFEDTLFATVRKTAEGAGAPMAAAWKQVLEKMQDGGTLAGAKASTTAEQMADQMHSAMRNTRAASMRAAQAMAESYTAMVSGVLIGMSEALQSGKLPASKKK